MEIYGTVDLGQEKNRLKISLLLGVKRRGHFKKAKLKDIEQRPFRHSYSFPSAQHGPAFCPDPEAQQRVAPEASARHPAKAPSDLHGAFWPRHLLQLSDISRSVSKVLCFVIEFHLAGDLF